MSNNIKEINEILFDRLQKKVPSEFTYRITDGPRRFFVNDKEMELLKKSKIDDIYRVFPTKPLYKISYYNREEEEKTFFVVIPDQSDIEEPFMRGVIRKLDENIAGLLTLVWSNDYPFSSNISYDGLLYEKIFGSEGDFHLEDIQDFFIHCEIWEVDEQTYNLDPYSIYGAWLTNFPSKLSLEFNNDTLLKYRQSFEESFSQFVAEPLFRSLTSTHFEHSFLESYRCIERLYHIPYVQELLLLTKDGTTTSNLAAQIEQKLSWRPKEEAALGKLINILNDSELNYNFFLCLNIDNDKQTKPYSETDINQLATTLVTALGTLTQKKRIRSCSIRAYK